MRNEGLLRMVVAGAFLAAFGISAYHRRRAAARVGGHRPERTDEPVVLRVVRVFAALPLYIGFLLYLVHPPWMEWAQVGLPLWLRWLGAGLVLAAVPLTWWVMSHLGTNVTETSLATGDHSLVTTGPYRWVRHPLYTDAILLWTGVSLASANLQLGLFTVIFTLVWMALVIPREEKVLRTELGDEYARYAERTGRLLPRLRR